MPITLSIKQNPKASMPEGVGNLGAVTLGNKIYAIAADVTYEYTPSTNTWVTKTPMPTPRSSFGIAAVGDKIFVIGGLMDGNSVTDVNEVYDSVTDSWETKTPMPTARWLLEANTVSNKIFLIGGNGGRDVSEVYDPSTDSWSEYLVVEFKFMIQKLTCGVTDSRHHKRLSRHLQV